ncbi:MAG: lipase [Actinomycetia bacterium]|nr:lipase [Actinomycetes bacterium]
MIEIPLLDGPVQISGALELERTTAGLRPRRLPGWARPQLPSDFCDMVVAQPSGVRLEFGTAATRLELDVLITKTRFADAPAVQPAGAFDLVADGTALTRLPVPDGNVLVMDTERGGRLIPGAPSTVRFGPLPAGVKELEIWLPHACQVELIALRADAPVRAPRRPDRPRWVHHGSSISHCGEAAGPLGTWPVVAARLAGADVLNLGLAGNAMVDQFTARTIRDQSADLISLKLGINVVNGDTMRPRTFAPAVHGFLDTVRDGHPRTPMMLISPIACPTAEHRPGPTPSCWANGVLSFRAIGTPAADALTLTVVREILQNIVERRSDPYLHYLDGRELFGETDVADLPDGLHPNAAGYQRMGERFAPFIGLHARTAIIPGQGAAAGARPASS